MANTLLLLTSCLIGGAAAARGGAFRDGAAAAVAAVVPARRSLLQTSLTYPPVGLTSNNFTLTGAAYGNGAYFATAASTPSSAWYGFDKTGAHWENCGVETCNQYCYQGANYACGVQYTPLVNEGNYGGEWLQITLPDAIQLTSYTLSSAGDYTSTPFSWSIAGSNDGVVWHGLDRRDNLNGGGNAVRTYSASASDSYKSFRITVSRVYMQPWDYNFIRIRELSLSGIPVIVSSPPPPPASWVQLTSTQATGRAFPTLKASATATGALSISVTATYTAKESTWRTLFNFAGLSAKLHTDSVNVASPGAPELVVPNFLAFSNANGASTRCSQGVYLTSASPDRYASWPLNTQATLTFTVDASGAVGVPSINGVPFELVTFPKDASWVPACAEVLLSGGEALFVGAQDGEADDFTGSIGDVVIDRVAA